MLSGFGEEPFSSFWGASMIILFSEVVAVSLFRDLWNRVRKKRISVPGSCGF